MKVPGIWVFFFVVGTALFVFTFCTSSSIPAHGLLLITGSDLTASYFLILLYANNSGMEFPQHGDGTSITGTSRKLKGNGYNPSTEKKSNVDLEDYHLIDPVPSSKASIKPGPIEHGSPLIPYIPKPSPPGYPKIGGST